MVVEINLNGWRINQKAQSIDVAIIIVVVLVFFKAAIVAVAVVIVY